MATEKEILRRGLPSSVLHYIAMGLMLCDHLWGTFLGNYGWLGYLGRMAFPLFAFLLAEGFFYTKNRKKYALRLLIFALISELPFNLMLEHSLINPLHQNVLWTFLLSIGLLSIYERIKRCGAVWLRVILYALATVVGYFLGFVCFVDYFGYGVIMVALFYFTRITPEMKPCRKLLLGIIQVAAMYWINCRMMKGMTIPVNLLGYTLEIYKQGFALLSLPMIWLYNGQQGFYNRTVKNVYYWFYPAHMFILGLLITIL